MNYLNKNQHHKKSNKITVSKTIMILVLSITFSGNVFTQNKVEMSDINILNNTKWQGNLMYINYSDGKEVYLKTEMQLEVKGNKIFMATQYNNEPNANSKGVIKLKKGGAYFGKEKVIEKSQLENGILKIVTMFEGQDNNKKATIYKTYLFNEKLYTVTKEVLFKDSEIKFIRNKYSYTRI